jgi:ubiquinone/menaquinone biosynthesis C-methylase UbiE
LAAIESIFDNRWVATDVPTSSRLAHPEWHEHVFSLANKPGMRVLEVGSREVCGPSVARKYFDKAEYVGFDFYPGANVDVVGDAHRLSEYFKPDDRFDLIFSSACFEHFAMPWIVSREIVKLLKVGGHCFVETHFAFSSHERPWHFFHFTDMGLRVLFPAAMGMECIDACMSNPIVGRFMKQSARYLRNTRVSHMFGFSEYLGKKVAEVDSFAWSTLRLTDVVGDLKYPAPRQA